MSDIQALLALQHDDLEIHALETRLAALEQRIRELDARRQRIVDTIDRQSELSEKQKRIVREISDATLADLARGVKEHFGRAQARVEAEEALRLETEAAVAKSRDELNEDDDESL